MTQTLEKPLANLILRWSIYPSKPCYGCARWRPLDLVENPPDALPGWPQLHEARLDAWVNTKRRKSMRLKSSRQRSRATSSVRICSRVTPCWGCFG
jgi:hypothetical protein